MQNRLGTQGQPSPGSSDPMGRAMCIASPSPVSPCQLATHKFLGGSICGKGPIAIIAPNHQRLHPVLSSISTSLTLPLTHLETMSNFPSENLDGADLKRQMERNFYEDMTGVSRWIRRWVPVICMVTMTVCIVWLLALVSKAMSCYGGYCTLQVSR
ncbi:hypothetical protein BCR44DRAFT_1119258 [Catenaria anguillulae PL171]|uniref:Uncharacterized protein n=1 Tax=Catenaria anguillulae PL171 TaxID=765915 RepID=A0A1Y2HNL3_9FUNG|nr:hypothetical protein BCR44DRAFT_1119258 [Catenaria anguillulae PL171]